MFQKIGAALGSFFGKIGDGIRRFMTGRYGAYRGNDELNKLIWGLIILMLVLQLITKSQVFYWLYWVFFILLLFRTLSKNIDARMRENDKFLAIIRLIKAQLTQGREYKIFMCSKCGRIVRIPRHHGRVEASCPQCGEKKIVNTGKKA